MAKTNPLEFIREVRQETNKVTWPTRKETMITTAMVFVFVIIASLFFLVADQIIGWAVSYILRIGR
jgi:preprotein translocase subunit SecE